MVLIGIAAMMVGVAAILCGTALLLKVLGIKVKEPERELTEDEKRALAASIRANEKWSAAMDSLVFGAPQGGDGF